MLKRLVAASLAIFMLFTIIGCGKKEEEETVEVKDTKKQENKEMITRFLDALVADDYKKVSEFLYSSESVDSFKEYCQNNEIENEIDFSEGYKIHRYIDESSGDSTGDVKGTIYYYDIKLNFGEKKCYVALQILDDGKKSGIVSFEVGHWADVQ